MRALVRRLQAKAAACGRQGLDVMTYLGFFCLRNHEYRQKLGWCAEMIYIHGKLLIVDDRVLICGSANINDRSQCGDRDGEVCVVLKPERDNPEAWVETFMGGDQIEGGSLRASVPSLEQPKVRVGRLAHDMRCRLWAEHLSGYFKEGPLPPDMYQQVRPIPACADPGGDLQIFI